MTSSTRSGRPSACTSSSTRTTTSTAGGYHSIAFMMDAAWNNHEEYVDDFRQRNQVSPATANRSWTKNCLKTGTPLQKTCCAAKVQPLRESSYGHCAHSTRTTPNFGVAVRIVPGLQAVHGPRLAT